MPSRIWANCFLTMSIPRIAERNNALFGPLIERKSDYCRHEVRYLCRMAVSAGSGVYARLIIDAHDQTIGTAGTLLDVTDRHEVQMTSCVLPCTRPKPPTRQRAAGFGDHVA